MCRSMGWPGSATVSTASVTASVILSASCVCVCLFVLGKKRLWVVSQLLGFFC